MVGSDLNPAAGKRARPQYINKKFEPVKCLSKIPIIYIYDRNFFIVLPEEVPWPAIFVAIFLPLASLPAISYPLFSSPSVGKAAAAGGLFIPSGKHKINNCPEP